MAFAVIDAETDPFQHDRQPWPFLWGYFDGERFAHWWGRGREDELVRYLCALPKETIVYAHNGGKFDFHYLTPWLDPDQELFVINGRIVRAYLKNGPQLRDSFALIPESLGSATRGAKIEKRKITIAHLESHRRDAHRREIVEYNRADCESLYSLIAAFHEEHGDALTLPQAALRKWREIQEVPRPRSSESFDSTFRKFYFGGRCQTFTQGIVREPFEVWDINSAYPRAMMEDHPYGADRISLRSLPHPRILPRCFVHLRAKSWGALPIREEDGALSFPNDGDARDFYATGHEIIAGLETGSLEIDRIHACHVFTQTINFRPFIEHYWARRVAAKAKGDQLENLISKRTMNGLYGKLAQNPRGRRTHRIADARSVRQLQVEGFEHAGTLGPWLLLSRRKEDAFGFLNVATAASITGWVRAYLLRALCTVGRPLYCDTDSIACARFPRELPRGSGLGEWGLEHCATWGAFAGKKLYAWRIENDDWKIASKGVKLSAAEIVKIARGAAIEWRSEAPTFRLGEVPQFLTRTIRTKGMKQCPPRKRTTRSPKSSAKSCRSSAPRRSRNS